MEMGCKICEKYEEHYYRDHLNGKGVEFYELMNGDFSKYVRIPKKFADYCKEELPEVVDLKGPSGNIWPVGLKKTTDEMLLQSGWKEFVKAHHVHERDLLVFKYDGNSCFDISIFDKNCFKKTSCLFMGRNSEKLERSENSVDILSVKSCRKGILRSFSHRPHNDILHAPPFSNNCKISKENKRTASSFQRAESSYKKRMARRNEFSACPKNKWHKHCSHIDAEDRSDNIKQEPVDVCIHEKLTNLNIYMSRRTILTEEEEKRVLQLAHAVQPNNPRFISLLRPGSVCNGCFLYVPTGFRQAHLPSENCIIFLQVPGQSKRWSIDLFVGESFSRFYWKSFVLDNSLQVGDACLFELNNDLTDIVLTVSILRAAGQEG